MADRTSNGRCRLFVNARRDFTSSTIYAKTLIPGVYVVYSYGPHFPMYACIGEKWYANSDSYSRTTGKHKSQARPCFDTIPVTTAQLNDLIDAAYWTAVSKAIDAKKVA